MKKIFKFILIIPVYIFFAVEGFIGGGTNQKDIWDKLITWVNK